MLITVNIDDIDETPAIIAEALSRDEDEPVEAESLADAIREAVDNGFEVRFEG